MAVEGAVDVGTAWVQIVPSAVGFAKKLRGTLEREIRTARLDELVEQAFARADVKVPVRAMVESFDQTVIRPRVEPDLTGVREKVDRALEATRAQVKVDLDLDKDGGDRLGTLFKGLGGATQTLGKVTSGLTDIGAAAQRAAGSTAQLGGNLVGAVTTATGPIGAVVGALIGVASAGALVGSAIAGGFTIGIPAVSALTAAVAAIPTVVAGAAAALATLKLGFSGIADAFKDAPGGGGGGGGGEDPASRARRIAGAERAVEAARRGITSANRNLAAAQRNLADAERNVAEAVQRSLRAQEDVNRARREAREDLEDLNRALRGARLDEESAALAVTEALRELNQVREQGNLPDIQRAELAYRQSLLTLENAKDAAEDLGLEQADAAKKGVEGSDKVQDALRAQVDAQQGVRDAQQGVLGAQDAVLSANDGLKASYDGLASAQDSLAEAQKRVASSGGAVAGQMVKLAPSAQRFVDAVKALKPAFDDLRLDVQERLFKGLDVTVTSMWRAWQTQLHVTLGSFATTLNGFLRNLGTAVSQPKFISDLAVGAESVRSAMEAIGQAVTSKLVPAFGALARAGAPFIEALGEELAGVVTSFSDWVLAGERSGKLQEFFTTATQSMRELFDIGGTVTSIIGNLVQIITGQSLNTGKTPLASFNDQLVKVNQWLNDPQNQEKVRKFFGTISDGVAVAIAAIDTLRPAFAKVGEFLDLFNGLHEKIKAKVDGEGLGAAIVSGILAGMGTLMTLNFKFVAGLLWEGPNSLLGRIKSGFGIASPSKVTTVFGREIINGLIKGMVERFGALVQRARELPGRIRSGLGNAGQILYTHGRNVVVGLANGALSYFGRLRTWVGQLRGAITGALSNAGSMLWNAGRNTVIGLWNGISSLGGWLWNKVKDFVRNNVKDAFTFGLDLGSPSKMTYQMGRYVSQGLALGMEADADLVSDAAERIAAAAMPDIASSTLAASPLSNLQPGRLTIAVEGTGDWLVDGLRRNISVRYQGDPVAALGAR